MTIEEAPMNQDERCLWLIKALLKDMPEYADTPIPTLRMKRWPLLRGLMNVRPPLPVSADFLRVQDAYLRQMTAEKGVVALDTLRPCALDPRMHLWQGDITTLGCDAIVNAANSQLLGCFAPGHSCIDNIIHTMAGVQLRLACNELMQAQEEEEPAGRAKITPGFNLPAKYVLHTVGPIVGEEVTAEDERLLASCYRSCLELAGEKGLQSVAFCCISTGVFRFPQERAAEIAVGTVKECLAEESSVRRVIFNVFKDSDLEIYRKLLD